MECGMRIYTAHKTPINMVDIRCTCIVSLTILDRARSLVKPIGDRCMHCAYASHFQDYSFKVERYNKYGQHVMMQYRLRNPMRERDEIAV